MGKTVIIANKLPVSIQFDSVTKKFVLKDTIGGLATGMKTVHEQDNSLWIGWNGSEADDMTKAQKKQLKEDLLKNHKCIPVYLNRDLVDGFYYGFCNKTIWPLFHYFTQSTYYDDNLWDKYEEGNRIFFDSIKEHLEPDDTVWIHDYQLMLLPQMIRKEFPNITIGYFLHIPFPSYEVFRQMPWRKEMLEGLLGANLLGFHTYEYVRHFTSSVRRILGLDNTFGKIAQKKHTVLADAFPMGIDYDKFSEAGRKVSTTDNTQNLLNETEGKQIILSVDRLDYTKGIPERIRAYEKFLDENPEYHGKVHLILITAPSREEVAEYIALKNDVENLVGHVNGKLGKIGWVPIWFMCQTFNFKELVSLYKVADVLLVTPIRDGMNLVVKEYIAAKTDYKGAIVLSETAGAASELGESLLINPNDAKSISGALKTALEMPVLEQITRNKIMHKRLSRYNVTKWSDDFITKLNKEKENMADLIMHKLSVVAKEAIVSDYKKSKKALIIFDYDGTLVPIEKLPELAAPDKKLLSQISAMAANPKNKVLFVSGRKKDEMAEWFKDLPIDIVAEHGFWHRAAGSEWIAELAIHNEWKEEIIEIVETYVDSTPGSFLEEKTVGLAWHYRNCEPSQAKVRLNELRETLMNYTRNLNLSILEGDKVLEVRDVNANKGYVVDKWLAEDDWDFVFCAGDDVTDEDMFQVLDENAHSVKIGMSHSAAKYNVSSYLEVRDLLKSFVDVQNLN